MKTQVQEKRYSKNAMRHAKNAVQEEKEMKQTAFLVVVNSTKLNLNQTQNA